MSAGPLNAYGVTPATTVAGFALQLAIEVDGEWGCGHGLALDDNVADDHAEINAAVEALAVEVGEDKGCALVGVWREYVRVDAADHGEVRRTLNHLIERAGTLRSRGRVLEQRATLLAIGVGRIHDLAEQQVGFEWQAPCANKVERAEARGFERATRAAGEALTVVLAELARAHDRLEAGTLGAMSTQSPEPETTEVSVETPAKNVETTEVAATPETAGGVQPDEVTQALEA